MNLKDKLIELICGKGEIKGQIYDFIVKEMRPQDDVVNDYRGTELSESGPRHSTPSVDDGTTYLMTISKDGTTIPFNNNPEYWPNMIDRLSTPFDYVERILLQDFSREMFKENGRDENWFVDSVELTPTHKLKQFRVGYEKIDLKGDNGEVLEDARGKKHSYEGEFFLDSFTYTPFIDHSKVQEGGFDTIGAYSDEFLNDFNSGKYLEGYKGLGKKEQVDKNRHDISTTLYRLRNLEKDIYDAKIGFRKSIEEETDAKAYIYTFCEHIASIFAKLSNIRMSHVMYGFQHPHRQWEGILALDIWYQLLYKNIDEQYPFDDNYLNMNPMSRKLVKHDEDGDYVELDGNKLYRDQVESLGLTWIQDDNDSGYAFIWNQGLYDTYNQNAHRIAKKRTECVLPRGVLEKIWHIVNDGVPWEDVVDRKETDDFPWFYQRGNVYSDSSKKVFSKYINLHLGRAYQAMTPREYCELMEENPPDGKWVKPNWNKFNDGQKIDISIKMLKAGCFALDDAFQVIKNEHLFNVYGINCNSSQVVCEDSDYVVRNKDSSKIVCDLLTNSSGVYEFDITNIKCYSQAQCAIAMERIFSRLYKYLHFKSTTGEEFQTHVNIDNGYKYLDTKSLIDNGQVAYYNDHPDLEKEEKDYLHYLTKLKTYVDDKNGVLYQNERAILDNFIKVLSTQSMGWLNDSWDLCPFCQVNNHSGEQYFPREQVLKMLSRDAVGSSDEDEVPYARFVQLCFNLSEFMEINQADMDKEQTLFELQYDPNDRPYCAKYSTTSLVTGFKLKVSDFKNILKQPPKYVDSNTGETMEYVFLGFSRNPNANVPEFNLDSEITGWDFGDQFTLILHAVWKPTVMVKFLSGDLECNETMPSMTVEMGVPFKLPKCEFTLRDEYKHPMFRYNEGSQWKNTTHVSEEVYLYKFVGWDCIINGQRVVLDEGQKVSINLNASKVPVVNIVAQWSPVWDSIDFKVGNEVYCEALVDRKYPILAYPEPPILKDDVVFIGWNIPEGEWLSGIERTDFVVCKEDTSDVICNIGDVEIVCGNGEPICYDRAICGDEEEPIICQPESIGKYDVWISARTAIEVLTTYNVTFKYLDETGEQVEKSVQVEENQNIPRFHIHQEVQHEGGKYQFRYWRLESGNLTSSFTVLSDLVFVATYDNVVDYDYQQVESCESSLGRLEDAILQSSVGNLDCQFIGDYDPEETNHTHGNFCKYVGVEPKESIFDLSKQGCPYARLLIKMAGNNLDEQNDFSVMSIMEIEDVNNLLSALFKVNLDIAHNERFVKVFIPRKSDWWYGCLEVVDLGDGGTICYSDLICECDSSTDVVCDYDEQIVCNQHPTDIVCSYNASTSIVCDERYIQKWYSFEPCVEFKFSNFHAANQIQENNKLVCSYSKGNNDGIKLTPINRELLDDKGIHYNEIYYCQDYFNQYKETIETPQQQLKVNLDDSQRYYKVDRLALYENTSLQSPTDVNDFVKHRLGWITRDNDRQVRTLTSIVKKYRPLVMPNVSDLFERNCSETKYQADISNDYGVFGWCTIPSKTMVNMEYNEESIVVPSSFDHHNRIGGSNFLQMDKDFDLIYRACVGNKNSNWDTSPTTRDSWYYLYNTRDWTYFMLPFFNKKRNNEIYSSQLDTYPTSKRPTNSNHLNGVIFEASAIGRNYDKQFGDVVRTCQFLAKYHHNENNLHVLAEKYTNLVPYSKLIELTQNDKLGFNSMYGSEYQEFPKNPRLPIQDWIDDYNMTGSYVDDGKYSYVLGQSHAIDDFDEDSVWFYITMVEPLEDVNQVIELEDIMPFVFWWENRGTQNNGPTVDAYGKQSNAKLNYEEGGWCYSGAHERQDEILELVDGVEKRTPYLDAEHRWHAVQHTIGTDFSKKEYGGTVLTTDNSGNVHKGAFDPNCSGTDEKWKVHDTMTAFGTNQHEDPTEDKYYHGETTHGEGKFKRQNVPDDMNQEILDSISNRPMTWNLWNVVRHYAWFKYFKNKHRELGNDYSAWKDLESYTKKIVKGIYRTFKQNQKTGKQRNTFGDIDESPTNVGETCNVYWTNSFAQISTILERNAREHEASFVLFTGDVRDPESSWISDTISQWKSQGSEYKDAMSGFNDKQLEELAIAKWKYQEIRNSTHNFVVTTLDGVDEDTDGMRPREKTIDGNTWWKPKETKPEGMDDDTWNLKAYQGFKHSDLPPAYVLGDSLTYKQREPDVDVSFGGLLDFDKEFPESEYHLGETTQKWIRKILQTTMSKQMLPIYTSMEGMEQDVHDLTEEDMKGITFQVVPQFYWRYEWSFNDFMIHRVGKLNSPSKDIVMYDMLGNVWEWVRDDWSNKISALNNSINPIVGTKIEDPDKTKVIKGGAFDQLVRKVISPSREEASPKTCKSKYATQANIGFRPAMVFTNEGETTGFQAGETPVDLFFLFDASASQDSEIGEMLRSAKEIVSKFAGNGSNKDMCHVGSALFLGPSIRLMCAKKLKEFVQHVWNEKSQTYVDYGYMLEKDYNKYGPPPVPQPYPCSYTPGDWMVTCVPYKYKRYDYNAGYSPQYVEQKSSYNPYAEDAEHWIKGDIDTPDNYLSGTGADGQPSGLRTKFNDFKENVWMAGSQEDEQQKVLTKSRDASPGSSSGGSTHYDPPSGGSGGGGSTASGPVYVRYVSSMSMSVSFESGSKKSSAFCGVPTWKEEITEEYKDNHPDWANDPNVVKFDGQWFKMHFGEIPTGIIYIDDVPQNMFVNEEGHICSSIDETKRAMFYSTDRNAVGTLDMSGDTKSGICYVTLEYKSDSWTGCSEDEYERQLKDNYLYFNYEYRKTRDYHTRKDVYLKRTPITYVYIHKEEGGELVQIGKYKLASEYDGGIYQLSKVKINAEQEDLGKTIYAKYVKDGENGVQVSILQDVDQYSDWGRYLGDKWATREMFSKKFPFFTYDISKNGIEDFEFPFMDNGDFKGSISNWWNGCEPVCKTLAKLLKDGFFADFPYVSNFGYVFRKDVPKLVFVFSNEFDNQYSHVWSIGSSGSYYSSSWWNNDTKTGQVTQLNTNGNSQVKLSSKTIGLSPLDEFCVQTLLEPEEDISQFLENIGVEDSNGMDVAMSNLRETLVGENRLQPLNYTFSISRANLGLPHEKYVIGSSILHNGNLAKAVLTDDQMANLVDNGVPYGHYEDTEKNGQYLIPYDQLCTPGFYDFSSALKNDVDQPFNTYMLVSDANAPRPLYEVEDVPGDTKSEWWDNPDNLKELSNSFLLGQDVFGLMDTIRDLRLPDDVIERIHYLGYWNTNQKLNWSNMLQLCNRHFASINLKTLNDGYSSNATCNDFYKLNYVVGVSNPYTRYIIVYGSRSASGVVGWKTPYVAPKTMPTVITETKDNKTTYYRNYSRKMTFVLGLGERFQTTSNEFFETNVLPHIHFIDSEDGSTDFPTNWLDIVLAYVYKETENPEGYYSFKDDPEDENKKYEAPYLTPESKVWIDKHMCFADERWDDKSRVAQGKMCKYNLDEENLEYAVVQITMTYETDGANSPEDLENKEYKNFSAKVNATKNCFIDFLFSSESYGKGHAKTTNYGGGGNSIYSTSSTYYNSTYDGSYFKLHTPCDYITIEYDSGGCLKLISFDTNTGYDKYAYDQIIYCGYSNKPSYQIQYGIYQELKKTKETRYPDLWLKIIRCGCTYNANDKYTTDPHVEATAYANADKDPLEDKEILQFLHRFFKGIKQAMPLMLSYRYYKQICQPLTNIKGKSVVDYEDEENTVVIKPIPIMNVSEMTDVFSDAFRGGNFEFGKDFSYKHCVIDLDPDYQKYNKKYKNDDGSLKDPKDKILCVAKGQFPMKFTSVSNVNKDEYKTTKLVLSRIDAISGEKFDKFTMGSHDTDYLQVVDPMKRKYRDPGALVDDSPEDNANVILGNGGSYQKNVVNVDLATFNSMSPEEKEQYCAHTGYVPEQDLYNNIEVEARDKNGEVILLKDKNGNNPDDDGYVRTPKMIKKYFKNKHFFIDPFALTISQWCYIKLNSQMVSTDVVNKADKETARDLLQQEGNLSQIDKSYWKYLSVWEKDEWKQEKETWIAQGATFETQVLEFITKWKQQNERKVDETEFEYDNRALEAAKERSLDKDDEWWQQTFFDEHLYDPLEDTRPYYYATYENVRGNTQTYSKPNPTPTDWVKYVMDDEKGDEFQLNTTGGTTSFMDILNTKVVHQTQKRIYGDGDVMSVSEYESMFGQNPTPTYIEQKVNDLKGDEYDQYGESPLMQYLMDARDNKYFDKSAKSKKKRTWCSGKLGGLNFDLPTEAQWEYCCRAGTTTPIPPTYNLEYLFEERHEEGLDPIAWYKYKVIGSLPEPERFCAWRISKLLFGISKDKEQVNNVYEMYPDN